LAATVVAAIRSVAVFSTTAAWPSLSDKVERTTSATPVFRTVAPPSLLLPETVTPCSRRRVAFRTMLPLAPDVLAEIAVSMSTASPKTAKAAPPPRLRLRVSVTRSRVSEPPAPTRMPPPAASSPVAQPLRTSIPSRPRTAAGSTSKMRNCPIGSPDTAPPSGTRRSTTAPAPTSRIDKGAPLAARAWMARVDSTE
jgi:hypothetical protein